MALLIINNFPAFTLMFCLFVCFILFCSINRDRMTPVTNHAQVGFHCLIAKVQLLVFLQAPAMVQSIEG